MARAAHRSSGILPQPIDSPYEEPVFHPKPMPMDERNVIVYGAGERNMHWSTYYIFDRKDDGAFRIKFHRGSPHDGLRIHIAVQNDLAGSIHPFVLILDEDGRSEVYHNHRLLTRFWGQLFDTGMPTWVWVRYFHGRIDIGLGQYVGRNMVASAETQNTYGGNYGRFAVGKTQNTGAFELLEVQPMQRRFSRNGLNTRVFP